MPTLHSHTHLQAPQADTKTFGQTVAKLNKDKGFIHEQQERQPVTGVQTH
jgi:hypothetical protein